MLPTFEKSTFCKAFYGEDDGLSIWGNGARMLSRSIKNSIPYRPFQQNFEDFGIVLAVSVSQFYQSIAVQL